METNVQFCLYRDLGNLVSISRYRVGATFFVIVNIIVVHKNVRRRSEAVLDHVLKIYVTSRIAIKAFHFTVLIIFQKPIYESERFYSVLAGNVIFFPPLINLVPLPVQKVINFKILRLFSVGSCLPVQSFPIIKQQQMQNKSNVSTIQKTAASNQNVESDFTIGSCSPVQSFPTQYYVSPNYEGPETSMTVGEAEPIYESDSD